tara:strand:+ start:431 stop:742 length:312 start_codon:yes stop_codon:yes gene_type:complete
MKLPRTVNIAGRRIRLVVEPFKGMDSDTFGEYFHEDKLIQINAGMDESTTVDTLRHEVMEASLLLSGVGFSEGYEQEAVVRCMDEIFFPAWSLILKSINFHNE